MKHEDLISGLGPGRIQKAPENFLGRADVQTVVAEAKNGRRDFIRGAFAAAAAGTNAAVPSDCGRRR